MQSVSDTARNAGDVANGQVRNFLDNVEDLTKALRDVDTPDIAKLRAQSGMVTLDYGFVNTGACESAIT